MRGILKSIKDFFAHTDWVLWLLALTATVYSILLILSLQRAGDYNYLLTQSAAIVIGIGAAAVLALLDYGFLLKYWWVAAITAIALAGMVFIFGIQVAGTDDTAWIRLPGGFTVQPSEFIKICFIITFTKHLQYLQEHNKIKSFPGVCTLVFHALIPIILIHLQGDDGTVLIFAFIFLVMTFTAGVQLRYYIALGAGLVVGIPLIWNFVLNDEHRNRILALFDLDGNAMTNYGWQQYQGKVSIASGQLSGKGLFNGARVGYGIVPEQQNDFIFTVAGEELGFIGCMLILLILLGILIRIMVNAMKSKDLCGSFLCYGIFAMIASQSVINIGMVLGFIPVVGITLPFFSTGGSSVLSMFMCLGIVQSVVMHHNREIDKVKLRAGHQDRMKL